MTPKLPKLNFPAIKLRARRVANSNSIEVWDSIRGSYLVLTPEEWVRQHVIAYLIAHHKIAPQLICTEYPVNLNGQAQRADIVVVDSNAQPQILVECKAAEIPINREVYAQAVRYNSVVKAQYIVLTNGLHHHCFKLSADGSYTPTKELF